MQGMRVAKTMFAVVLAFGILSGIGFSQLAGVDVGTGGLEVEDAEEISDEASESEVEDFGGQDASNFGITTGVVAVATGLWVVIIETGPILISWGVPEIIARAAHAMAVLSFALAIVAIFRGLNRL